ncbi:cuticle collagen 2C-like [Panicum virgatum]|uniref:cuticle collagen 2C-like n=1 Tax=Panicum virgatum TaxID=38727 RepID=UPI0019D609F5|nr:cuticle collagen 2C-like [Panicum virgatum]
MEPAHGRLCCCCAQAGPGRCPLPAVCAAPGRGASGPLLSSALDPPLALRPSSSPLLLALDPPMVPRSLVLHRPGATRSPPWPWAPPLPRGRERCCSCAGPPARVGVITGAIGPGADAAALALPPLLAGSAGMDAPTTPAVDAGPAGLQPSPSCAAAAPACAAASCER